MSTSALTFFAALVPFFVTTDEDGVGVSSARFATVRFMFQHKGRVRVMLDKQSAESGGVDSLLEETLAAGAEDFDQIPGSGEDVEVEVRELSLTNPSPCVMYNHLMADGRFCARRMRWGG